jgi:phage/plasmid-like protein (TIGR03299 family)
MAHELAFNANGTAECFSVRLTPWHREGVVLPAALPYEESIKLIGFDYPLEKRPHFRPVDVNDPAKGFTEAGDSHYVYRPDTGKTLGAVGSSYEIVSNLKAFQALKPLADSGVFTIETGGVLRDGADAWLLGKWDLEKLGSAAREVFGGEVAPYSTVLANHNGRRGILLGNTPVRIVCANTLGAAETSGNSRWATVSHVSGAKARLLEAAEGIFAGALQRFEAIAAQYRLLKSRLLNQETFARLVLDVVAPDPRQDSRFNPESKLAESVLARAERKRNEVTRLWKEGRGHTGESSGWFAYNAAVEAIDFNRDLWPTRDGSWRTASLLDGTLARMKSRVLDGLVEYAQSV